MRHTLRSEEIRDLALAAFGLGAAFALWRFGTAADAPASLVSAEFAGMVGLATGLVAVSYIPHVMAHRVTARSMDAYAEFELWRPGVVIAMLTAVLGVVVAAVGGTRMYDRDAERYGLTIPHLNVKMIGFISVIGPLINISLAVLFAFMATAVQDTTAAGISLFQVMQFGANINSFMALASLLPFYPMDGYKILRWSTTMWILSILLGALTFLLV